MQPLISIIVPVYNGQDYLPKCIESIERQTYPNLEVIIIDDGSTDGTGEVLKKLVREYNNIHVVATKDEGVSVARNAGLDGASGEYITFVDADDRLLAGTIQFLYDGIKETGSDIAGCGFVLWKDEEEWEKISGSSSVGTGRHTRGKTDIYSALEFLQQGILNGNSRCWSKLYKRSAIGEIRFRQGLTIGEDMLFLIDILPNIKQAAEISYNGYGYFQNPKGAMNRKFLPQYMDQITCWELAREEIARRGSRWADVEMVQRGSEAEREQEGLWEQLFIQVTSILLMAIMLTVGKLALLSAKDRKEQSQYIELCHEKLKKELQVPEVYKRLSRGYKVKVTVFQRMPSLYLLLYHLRKYKK